MRKILALVLCGLLLSVAAYAELRGSTVNAYSGSQTVAVDAGSLTVVNSGSATVFIRVFEAGNTIGDATTTSPALAGGATLNLSRPNGISAISIVSASTSTVYLYYW